MNNTDQRRVKTITQNNGRTKTS